MLSGYVRVSKSDGSPALDLQRDALAEAGVEASRIYDDLASGRRDDWPGLTTCLKALQPGNTLVVWKLDRLGRDLKRLVDLVDTLNQRQVGLKVLAGAGTQIDTTTANGRLVFGVFAALAEFEAALIRERTKAGLTAVRARGRVGGRPRKMAANTIKMAMTALADPGSSPKEVARRLGITTTTLYTYVNGDGSPKASGQRLLNAVWRFLTHVYAEHACRTPARPEGESPRARGAGDLGPAKAASPALLWCLYPCAGPLASCARHVSPSLVLPHICADAAHAVGQGEVCQSIPPHLAPETAAPMCRQSGG